MSLAAYPAYDDYKSSGVEWASETPQHWDIKPITAIAEVVSVANQPDLELLSVYLNEGVIRFSDVDAKRTNATSVDLTKYQIVDPGNLVLNNQQAWRGSVGVSNYRGIVSPAYIILKLSSCFDPTFANYYFRTSSTVAHYLVSSKGVGTIQRNLYWPSLKRCPVVIPPLPEQRAIALFLDDKCKKIDEAVRIKEAQIALLRERRQILIQEAVTRGLNPDAPLKDSGIDWIGQIPAHWEVKKVKHFAQNRSGDGITNSVLTDEGEYEVFGGNGLMGYSDRYNVDGDYIVIGRVGAYCGNVRLASGKRWISDNALILRIAQHIDNNYFSAVLQAANLNKMNESNAQPLITGTKVSNHQFPCAPTSEQMDIVSYLNILNEKIDTAISLKQDQITALKEYKTSLINAAVTGKIKVI